MRQSVLFMGATQIVESGRARESHPTIADCRLLIADCRSTRESDRKASPRSHSQSGPWRASRRLTQFDLVPALQVRDTHDEHVRKTPPAPVPFDLVDAAFAYAISRWPHRYREQK